jgi:hypothetical protein
MVEFLLMIARCGGSNSEQGQAAPPFRQSFSASRCREFSLFGQQFPIAPLARFVSKPFNSSASGFSDFRRALFCPMHGGICRCYRTISIEKDPELPSNAKNLSHVADCPLLKCP